VAWKSQRTRALDLAVFQAETTQLEVDTLRNELTGMHVQLEELHQQLARRDVELIGALAHVTTVTDQLRVQNEEDRAHHDRLDRAIELLTMVIASSAPALEQSTQAEVVDLDDSLPAPPTVIGGSVDPSLLARSTTQDPVIDLTAEGATEFPRRANPVPGANFAGPHGAALPRRVAERGE
jgi:deoxyribodipyrimidine photolyase